MPRPTLPMPPEFPAYAACEGNLKLRKRFNVGGVTIERWRRQIGAKYTPPAMPKKPATRPVMARKARKRWMAQECLEDLDDGFDVGVCLRGHGGW